MKVTRRTIFKEEGHTVTGTTTLTVHLKDATAACRMMIRLCAGWSRASVRNFVKSCPVPDTGLWTTSCSLTWMVGESHFKILISKRASVFVSPLVKQIKVCTLEGPMYHGDWNNAIRVAKCEELYEITDDARTRLHTNLMNRASILKGKMS